MAARSSSTEELLSTDQLQIHGTRLDSPAYCWDDTDDDDDDCGPKPRELYGTFMWTIDNFSQIDNKELRSNLFDVGGHKWERVDRPFRCLDEPYRRELSRVYLTNVETIVQQFIDERKRKIRKSIDDERIWSRLSAFWLGTDPSTRQQLTRENTDTILRLLVKYFFVEKEVTSTLLMDSLYAGLKVMKQVCKNTEDMVDIQWPGKYDSRSSPVVIIDKDNDMFVLAGDVILLLERVALLDSGSHQPSADCRSSENSTKEVYTLAQVRAGVAFDDTLKQACRHLAAFSMDGSKGSQDLSNTSPENDDVRLIKLGWMALEFFFLAHVFSCIEAVHQEAMALKLQEELIEDEERKKK
ncbi:unnamed protein product [Urochloa decumbens]|uniref:MATH domain-containing protein n=1 Tax=Urochloa decumbens TaxID=240449 RepID=A0ABC9B0M4_9POAL